MLEYVNLETYEISNDYYNLTISEGDTVAVILNGDMVCQYIAESCQPGIYK